MQLDFFIKEKYISPLDNLVEYSCNGLIKIYIFNSIVEFYLVDRFIDEDKDITETLLNIKRWVVKNFYYDKYILDLILTDPPPYVEPQILSNKYLVFKDNNLMLPRSRPFFISSPMLVDLFETDLEYLKVGIESIL